MGCLLLVRGCGLRRKKRTNSGPFAASTDQHSIYTPHAWGNTQQEAFENLKNAVDLIIAGLLEAGTPITTEPYPQAQTSNAPALTVTI
jgi:hypothetical protein